MLRVYAFVVLALALLTSACTVSERIEVSDAEGRVPDKFFKQVKPGKTEIQWVVANLGEPMFMETGPKGAQIYSYHFSRSKIKSANVLVLMSYASREEHSEYYHLVVCDNIVRKRWWDKFETVQMHKALRFVRCPHKQAMEQEEQASVEL
jgi:outer membrane protein assembly factor BamE (lipoprotein component of BamABCDE complex)